MNFTEPQNKIRKIFVNMPPYLANVNKNKIVLLNSTTTNFLSLGPTVDYNGNLNIIDDFRV